jgi:death on curing protein
MPSHFLNSEQIKWIHHELIKRFGGSHGIRDEGLLESAVGRYQQGYYSDIIEEAAALMESLGGNHAFVDGNKRIAVTAAFTFLMVNGYEVQLAENQAYDFIVGLLETQSFKFDKLEPWIRENVSKII